MKLSIATLLVGSAAASSIPSNSKVGQKLMNKARRLGGEDNMSWAANYSLKFEKCATSNEYYGGYFGGNQNQNQNGGNNNNDRQNFNGLYEQRLVHFKLCPSDTCGSGCSGGADYVIDLNEFVGAYIEYQQEALEQKCESVRENCYCDDANDDEACEAQCLMSAGIYDDCVEQDGGDNNGQDGEEFKLEEALECGRLEIDEEVDQYYNYENDGQQQQQQQYNGQNGNYNQQQQQQQQWQQDVEFFVGPFCSSNGKSINLGVFMDETCSFEAPDGIYEKYNYGKSLPYSSESIVSNECISCMEPVEEDENNDNNNNNNNGDYQEPEVLEFCERLYEASGKCESNLSAYGMYPNTMACEFISGLSGGLKTRIVNTFAEAKNHTAAVLAGVFAVSTVALAGFAYHLNKRMQGQEVGLVHAEGNMA